MSSNQFLIDAASRRAVFVQRYSAGLEAAAADQIRFALRQVSAILGTEDISTVSGAVFGSLRFEIIDSYNESMSVLLNDLMDELEAFVGQEGDFTAELLTRGTTATIRPPEQLQLALNLTEMSLDHPISIRAALSQFGQAKANQIDQLIKDAYAEGLTSQQAISRIKDIIPLQTRQASSLVRTATNTASTVARIKTMTENMDIFDGYEWVSTLDSRTSNVCMARDGKIYPFKADSPKPPAHWGCRSTIIPKVKRQYDLLASVSGVRPSVGASGPQEQSGATTYGAWLRMQPASFQDEVLGKTRARLFRSGGVSIDQFVDNTGRTYTLDQLRGLNPVAFERANV